MELQILPVAQTVCKVSSLQDIDFNSELCFLGKTDEVLADHGIGLFAVSTFNTDDILVKEAQFFDALRVLAEAGCQIRHGG